jgi:hypothetical protein
MKQMILNRRDVLAASFTNLPTQLERPSAENLSKSA